jgi:hypothetical protein
MAVNSFIATSLLGHFVSVALLSRLFSLVPAILFAIFHNLSDCFYVMWATLY